MTSWIKTKIGARSLPRIGAPTPSGWAWLLAGCALALASAAGADDDVLQGRHLTVSGQGVVRARPDLAVATVGVSVTAETAALAMAQHRRLMADLLQALEEAGVAQGDIITSDFGIHRQRPSRPAQDRPSRPPGFVVRNLLQVTIRDLDGAGALLDRLVEAGANEIQGIRFALGDDAELESQARALAAADARQKAEQLARLHGVHLGRVLRISESGVRPLRPDAVMRNLMAEASPTVSAGELTFAAHLQVIYALTD